jgi:CHAT domain-containing protein
MDPRPCSLAEARACLADDEVALNFVLGREASYLIVLAKDGGGPGSGLTVHTLPPAAEIAELVAALTRSGALGDADAARELGAGAYRTLLAPAAAAIAGKALVIVPGRSLGYLSFELLVEPDDYGPGRWLVERHRIRYAPSLTTLHFVGLWDRARQAPERPAWALGDPDYGDSGGPEGGSMMAEASRGLARAYRGESARGAIFERLPATRDEVRAVGVVLGARPGDALLGADATESAVKRLSASGDLARYRYIHFACHGILGRDDGLQPALVLARAADGDAEDGFLQLDEVTALRLNADLVTLSACETGRGRLYDAEGVAGLARAFLYAGSRSVLCSLWKVEDRGTAEQMTALYDGLKAGKPPAEALRAAQLKMIAEGEPPLHWAPFVLIGK